MRLKVLYLCVLSTLPLAGCSMFDSSDSSRVTKTAPDSVYEYNSSWIASRRGGAAMRDAGYQQVLGTPSALTVSPAAIAAASPREAEPGLLSNLNTNSVRDAKQSAIAKSISVAPIETVRPNQIVLPTSAAPAPAVTSTTAAVKKPKPKPKHKPVIKPPAPAPKVDCTPAAEQSATPAVEPSKVAEDVKPAEPTKAAAPVKPAAPSKAPEATKRKEGVTQTEATKSILAPTDTAT